MPLADQVARLPSLGWVSEPSALTALPALARHLGLASLTIKRDDLLGALHGGTKARKLDALLATAPFKDAPQWASLGAIGSGHLAACTAAAAQLGRSLEAHTFYEPISQGVLENLSFVASGPTRLHYYGSRLEVGLRKPALVTRPEVDGVPVIPPGAMLPAAIAGIVRAGFELAEQIRGGAIEAPELIYVALGSGGTTAGLALGLGLAGVKAELRAIACVERYFTSERKVGRLIAQAAQWLKAHGVDADAAKALRVKVVRGQLGPAYGVPTAQSLAAVEVLRLEGIPIEPVYAGKAFAALLAEAAVKRAPQRVLFWNTVRRGPLPHDAAWREKLPPRLARRLDRATSRPQLGRRVVLAGGLAAAGAIAVARVTGYPPLPGWTGTVLARWEAQVIAAAAEVLSGATEVEGLVVAANVDRFLTPVPPAMKAEIHQLMGLIEHGTTPLGLRLSRFTRLQPDAREAFLLSLNARGWLFAQAFRGLRDLVLMGTYQDARTWKALAYSGPWAPGLAGPESSLVKYEALRATGGAPRGAAK
ncbi:MAG: D-cysteine desulfhydrase [Myxococcaceae bacterium]|nr:D-cysteine desulfhydrase [Myxococcaceae bacterium]